MKTNISNVIDQSRPLFNNIGNWSWYADNWIAVVSIVIIISGLIVYKTKTKKDDMVFSKIVRVWSLLKYFFKRK